MRFPAVTAGVRWSSRPGSRPVDRLAPLLADDETAETGDPADAVPGSPVVLVVDQFEELWTAGAADGERVAFLDALLALLDEGVAARVVLVVRGDHLGRLSEHSELAERAGDGLLLVPPLTEAELGRWSKAPPPSRG